MTTVASDAAPSRAVRSPEPNLTDITLRLLAEAGIPAGSLRDMRMMIAAGQVYGAATEAVHNGSGDKGMIEFFDCLDTVVKHIVDLRPLKPLIDAAEKLDAENATTEPGHYPWCAPGKCVTQAFDDGEPYIEHVGHTLTANVHDGSRDKFSLQAGLGADESFVNEAATVYMHANEADALLLDATHLDQTIQELSAFVDGLRAMRRQMNQGRQS
ncbi:hypothetical protein [Streptomyces sp. NPDC051994]|uniref:DUF6907 domain-containing protein n=1 Tax=unclassified Streptomyces TaxID=2593676 RepID=UPI00341EA55C